MSGLFAICTFVEFLVVMYKFNLYICTSVCTYISLGEEWNFHVCLKGKGSYFLLVAIFTCLI